MASDTVSRDALLVTLVTAKEILATVRLGSCCVFQDANMPPVFPLTPGALCHSLAFGLQESHL